MKGRTEQTDQNNDSGHKGYTLNDRIENIDRGTFSPEAIRLATLPTLAEYERDIEYVHVLSVNCSTSIMNRRLDSIYTRNHCSDTHPSRKKPMNQWRHTVQTDIPLSTSGRSSTPDMSSWPGMTGMIWALTG